MITNIPNFISGCITSALNFILSSRTNTVVVVLAGYFVPGLNWIAFSVIALITLEYGAKAGLKLIAWSLLPALVLYLIGRSGFALHSLLMTTLFVWLLSSILNKTHSWRIVLESSVWLGIVGVLIIYMFFPGWLTELASKMEEINISTLTQMGYENEKVQMAHANNMMSKILGGIYMVAVIFYVMFTLALGRYFQAKIFNPGGFKKEFYNISINWMPGVLLILSCIGIAMNVSLAYSFLPVVVLPYLLVGISIIHNMASKREYTKVILCFFYFSMIIYTPIFSPAIIGIMIVLTLLDKKYNFRVKTNG